MSYDMMTAKDKLEVMSKANNDILEIIDGSLKDDLSRGDLQGVVEAITKNVVDKVEEHYESECDELEDDITTLEDDITTLKNEKLEDEDSLYAYKENVAKVFKDICDECLKTRICKLTGCLICAMKRDMDI